ncbi:hypothetical protein [Caulobacter sp. 17J80-11]|uniref:hypothetical protein n=1 Tax=Caulobacter sp. 17J80-11 TaxID=2763502 RepID=UPI00165375A7|nr:hypothetical protein [Caulobacter sp. 17J80-11]MBC6982903.1 hypothetical protein [Caulobacter sp. 17J80-11]
MSEPVEASEEKPAEEVTVWGVVVGLFGLSVIGVIGYGLFSVGSCTWNGVRNFGKELDEADAYYNARVKARAEAQQPVRSDGVSDAAVVVGAQKAVKEKLTDPDSAKFRSLSVYRQSSGVKVVCGEVNAKNRAGGYNGFERFISAGTTKYTWLEQEADDMNSLWREVCR